MTFPTKHDIEQRLDALDDDSEGDRVFVACIGGDPGRPRGWLTRAEYAEHYGDRPEGGFEFTINGGESE